MARELPTTESFLSVFELTPFATKAYQSAHISHFQRESVWRLG
jgi:hypothetical protein